MTSCAILQKDSIADISLNFASTSYDIMVGVYFENIYLRGGNEEIARKTNGMSFYQQQRFLLYGKLIFYQDVGVVWSLLVNLYSFCEIGYSICDDLLIFI